MFIAIVGQRFNGHNFINEAIKKGCTTFIVNQSYSNLTTPHTYIVVEDTLRALQKLAEHHSSKFQFPVIALTGSNGKTIVKEYLFQLLSQNYSIAKSPKSYNSQIGVPLSLLQIKPYNNLGIFETGISQPNEMAALEKMIQPTIGIFTNLGSAHDEGFNSRNAKLNEKLTLFTNCKTIIYNKDQKLAAKAIKQTYKNKQLIGWELNKEKFMINDFHISLKQINKSNSYLENLGHCIATLFSLGLPKSVIISRINQLQQIKHRLQVIEGKNKNKLINDSYNNDIAGLEVALNFAVKETNTGKLSLVITEMEQTGLIEEALFNQLFSLLSKYKISHLITLGTRFKKYRLQLKTVAEKFMVFSNVSELLKSKVIRSITKETILIKGARKYELEHLVQQIKLKQHDTIWEINLSTLIENLNYYRSKLTATTKLMVMVKALAYGAHAEEISKVLNRHKVEYLGVAYVEEGVHIRNAGVTTPILVMNTSIHQFQTAIDYNLEVQCFSIPHIKSFISILKDRKIKNYPIHLKLDTGMHRLGFEEKDLTELSELIRSEHVKIKGILSHLASAKTKPALQQINRFKAMANSLTNVLKEPPLLHILNTGGLENKLLPQFDMVRLGIGLYGVSPSKISKNKIQQVGLLKASISQLKIIEKGEAVGYDQSFLATKKMKIATITIGYADGFDRQFSNGVGKVIINNQIAPVIGLVCMDMCMVDVSHIKSVFLTDEVIITSPELPITELAELIGTSPYELLTKISTRIPREFTYE